MRGLVFDQQQSLTASAPNRADVACFVGFVARRTRREGVQRIPSPSILPNGAVAAGGGSPIYRWLLERGFALSADRVYARGAIDSSERSWMRTDAELDWLLDVPVPVESWEVFSRLFAWDQRPLRAPRDAERDDDVPTGLSYLGAAVRSFFSQGGHFCYVVRVGDPCPYEAALDTRRAQLARLLPGLARFPLSSLLQGAARARDLSPSDRASWSSLGHLYGLPDVSFLCLPDLADLLSAERPAPISPEQLGPAGSVDFVECSEPLPAPPASSYARLYQAPRLDEVGYGLWGKAVQAVGDLLQRHLREVQLVTSLPLPAQDPIVAGASKDLLAWLTSNENGWLVGQLNQAQEQQPPRGVAHPHGFASAFIQLAYPWVKTPMSRALPEGLETPEALLAGVLARNAVSRGSFRDAAGLALAEVLDTHPPLRAHERNQTLVQRVSLLGRTARGMELLSDVTSSLDPVYRQANVARLVSVIVRAARRLGEESVFEASGPALWARVQSSLESLLTTLWLEGALQGASPDAAFVVRCDRSTMTQQDLDAGRVLSEVRFVSAASIDAVRVVLALSAGSSSAGGAA